MTTTLTTMHESVARKVPIIITALVNELTHNIFGSFAQAKPGTKRNVDNSFNAFHASGLETRGDLKVALNNELAQHGFTISNVDYISAPDLGRVLVTITK